jgi:hypothetical protein
LKPVANPSNYVTNVVFAPGFVPGTWSGVFSFAASCMKLSLAQLILAAKIFGLVLLVELVFSVVPGVLR